MLQRTSVLRIIDNTGGILFRILTIPQKQKYAILTTKVFGVVIKLRRRFRKVAKVTKKQKLFGLIIKTNQVTIRKNFVKYKNFSNNIILLNHRGLPLGTRVFCGIPQELRKKKWVKLILISKFIY